MVIILLFDYMIWNNTPWRWPCKMERNMLEL